jgi:hypothetical protein
MEYNPGMGVARLCMVTSGLELVTRNNWFLKAIFHAICTL